MFKNYNFRRFDYILVLLVLLLGIIGIVAIGSATRIYSPEGTSAIMNKQIAGFVVGLFVMLFFAFFDYHWLGKLVVPIYIFNILLLALVLVAGDEGGGAARWINIGPVRLQPSEFAKIFMVLVLAKYFDVFQNQINKIYIIFGAVILTAVPTVMIFMQPDLSTSMIMFLILAFMIFVAGISYWYILGVTAVAVPTVIFGYNYITSPGQTLLADYQVRRILSLTDPDAVDPSLLWQTNFSKQAIGSGRLFGKGIFQGKINQYEYLPEPQTDFIFSIIGEEFGFFGCIIVVLLLFVLIVRCLWIAKDSIDLAGKLIITGVVAVITYQTFINIGVATGVVPNTGIPLPFISAGLSSLWNTLIGIGIILNVGMQRKTSQELREMNQDPRNPGYNKTVKGVRF